MTKTYTHILTILIVLGGLLPAGILHADESGSFQNFGSATDNASVDSAESGSFSAQDQSTTWRTTTTESASFQAGGSGNGTTEDSGGGSEESDGGGGSGGTGDGETGVASGGHRGRGTQAAGTVAPTTPAPTKPESPRTPVVRDKAPHASPPVARVTEQGIPPGVALGPSEGMGRTGSATLPGTQETLRPAAPGESPTAGMTTQRPYSGVTLLSSITVGHATILGRLGWMSVVESGFETLPAYASGEALTGTAGFALRPGAVRISTLVPFIAFKKRRRKRVTQEA